MGKAGGPLNGEVQSLISLSSTQIADGKHRSVSTERLVTQCIKLAQGIENSLVASQAVTRAKAKQSRLQKILADQKSVFSKDRGYTEREFTSVVINNLPLVLSELGLPESISFREQLVLPNNRKIDLIVYHHNSMISVCEIKTMLGTANYNCETCMYMAVGQLLFYLETLMRFNGVSEGEVNLCILSDYTPSDTYLNILKRTSPAIKFLNVYALLGERIKSGQPRLL